jgi:hypothetical protein
VSPVSPIACGWSESMTYARPVSVTATGWPSATVTPVTGAPTRTVRTARPSATSTTCASRVSTHTESPEGTAATMPCGIGTDGAEAWPGAASSLTVPSFLSTR